MRFAVAFATLATFGCGSIDSRDALVVLATGTLRNEVSTTNDTELNDTELNGTNLAASPSTSTLAAVHLAGAELHSAPMTALWLDKGELVGIDATGAAVAGADLVGLVLDAEHPDGTLLQVRLSGATDAGGGVWRYDFLYKPGTDNIWDPVCTTGSAIVVSGRWNYGDGVPGGGAFTPDSTVFTVACPNSAIEKCVGLGYLPWEQFGTVSGVDLHTSCARAIRADYCGDGHSHTTNGRLINIYDGAGVLADTESWVLEAEWTPAGASCVSAYARDALGITCSTVPATLDCGDPTHFAAGTREMTETLLGPVPITP